MNDYTTFIQAVIDTLRASPLATRMTVEEYDGRYESDQALKIVGDETVCFIGLESVTPAPISTQARLDGSFFAELTILLFIEKRRVGQFDEDNSGAKTVPFDDAMEVFRYLYTHPIDKQLDYVLPNEADGTYKVIEFSGFNNILRLPNIIVVGGTISYPIIIKTEAETEEP
jgi:hypothetical protein